MTIRLRSASEPNGRIGRFSYSIAGSLALSFAEAPFTLGLFALLALVPWIVATRRAGFFEAVLLGIVFGMVHGLVGASCLFPAFASQRAIGFRGVLATLITVFWAKGLLFGAMGLGVRWLRSWAPGLQTLVLATLFGLGEFWIGESRWGLPLLLLGNDHKSPARRPAGLLRRSALRPRVSEADSR